MQSAMTKIPILYCTMKKTGQPIRLTLLVTCHRATAVRKKTTTRWHRWTDYFAKCQWIAVEESGTNSLILEFVGKKMWTRNCLVTNILCSAAEEKSYRFGTTQGWENYDRIVIFGWTILLSLQYKYNETLIENGWNHFHILRHSNTQKYSRFAAAQKKTSVQRWDCRDF